ncbi:MAG: hypothetical protein II943_00845 [Victivallales bacterium]|nr:hypothetical protein [Victivallales bacterium]
MHYEITYFDESIGEFRRVNLRKQPFLLVRAHDPLNCREMLMAIFDQLPWRASKAKCVMAIHHPAGETAACFEAPWLSAPITLDETSAAGLQTEIDKAAKSFKSDPKHPFLTIILPWLDCLWSPAFAAMLSRLAKQKNALARRRVFLLLGASSELRLPFEIPEAAAETTTLAREAMYTTMELRAIRAIAFYQVPRRAWLWEKFGFPVALANAIWRELAAKGFITEKDGKVQIDGEGIEKALADFRPIDGCPDDLRLANELWLLETEEARKQTRQKS